MCEHLVGQGLLAGVFAAGIVSETRWRSMVKKPRLRNRGRFFGSNPTGLSETIIHESVTGTYLAGESLAGNDSSDAS